MDKINTYSDELTVGEVLDVVAESLVFMSSEADTFDIKALSGLSASEGKAVLTSFFLEVTKRLDQKTARDFINRHARASERRIT